MNSSLPSSSSPSSSMVTFTSSSQSSSSSSSQPLETSSTIESTSFSKVAEKRHQQELLGLVDELKEEKQPPPRTSTSSTSSKTKKRSGSSSSSGSSKAPKKKKVRPPSPKQYWAVVLRGPRGTKKVSVTVVEDKNNSFKCAECGNDMLHGSTATTAISCIGCNEGPICDRCLYPCQVDGCTTFTCDSCSLDWRCVQCHVRYCDTHGPEQTTKCACGDYMCTKHLDDEGCLTCAKMDNKEGDEDGDEEEEEEEDRANDKVEDCECGC